MPVDKARKRKKPAAQASSGRTFFRAVVEIVRAIPRGRILTYGQVAVLAGAPRASRIVGGVLYRLGPEERVPWQRVVNREGGLSTYKIGFGEKQRKLLEKEGVAFTARGCVDRKKHQWFPDKRLVKKWELPDHLAFDLQTRFRL